MIKIAFIVGKGSDVFPCNINSSKCPNWLKIGVKKFYDFINDDTVPSDVAMAAYINFNYKDADVTLYDGSTVGEELTLKECDKQDIIYVIYDAIEIFQCSSRYTCPIERNKFLNMMKQTKAFVCPPPDFHEYIINKPKYYADLKRAGIPVAPFFSVNPSEINTLAKTNTLKNEIIKKKWEGVIIKPSFAGYSLGIKVFKNIKRTLTKTLLNHFKKLQKYNYTNVTVQEFIPEFGDHFEIRTYWINGKYTNSVATLTEAVGGGSLPIEDIDTFKSEGGTLPDSILKKLKPVGRKVLKAILQYPYKQPMIRIDFGCCLSVNKCLNSYFINEVETMAANLLADDTDYPIVQSLAKECYKFAKKMKGKENILGKKSNVKYKNTVACKGKK